MPPPETTLADEIPDKQFFKIGEVAKLVGVEPYVLRYWEGQFGREIRPERSRTNQRVYRRRDVEAFLRIKALRYDERLQIPGAKRRLRVEKGEELPGSTRRLADRMEEALQDLLRIVDEDEASE